MRNMRFQNLESKAQAIHVEAFALESKTRTLDEREFLVVHGYIGRKRQMLPIVSNAPSRRTA